MSFSYAADRATRPLATSFQPQSASQSAPLDRMLPLQPDSLTSRSRVRSSFSNIFRSLGFKSDSKASLKIEPVANQISTSMVGDTFNNARYLGDLTGRAEYGWRDAVSGSQSDFYKITVGRSTRVKVTLDGLNANADVRILKASGLPVRSGTRSGTRRENVEGNLRAGEYYIQVMGKGSNANYTLGIRTRGRGMDAGNSMDNALSVGDVSRTKRTYLGKVGGTDASDFYRIYLSERNNVNLTLSGLAQDADLLLTDFKGNPIARSSTTGNRTESITQQLNPGTYFARVLPFNSAQEGNYNLQVIGSTGAITATPVPSPSPLPNPTPSPSTGPIVIPPPSIGPSPSPSPSPTGDPGNSLSSAQRQSAARFSRNGRVTAANGSNPNDFYRFSVDRSGVFTANLTGLSADADVKLIKDANSNGSIDAGEVLGWQWEWNTGNESIRRFVNAGDYFVQVFGYADANYTLNTDFTPASGDDRKFSISFNNKSGLESLGNGVRSALDGAARFWENAISHSSFNGAHNLLIDVTGINAGRDYLAAAKNDFGTADASGKWMPTTGTVRINTAFRSDYDSNPEYLKQILIHEFAHVLGVGTLWDKQGRNLIDRATTSYKADSYAGRAYGEILGTLKPTAIPLEAALGHWDENKLGDESLTPFAEPSGTKMPLSQITLASLRDIGWNVNYGAADNYAVPRNVMPDPTTSTSPITSPATSPTLPDGFLPCRCPRCSGNTTALGLNLVGSSSLSDAIGSPSA